MPVRTRAMAQDDDVHGDVYARLRDIPDPLPDTLPDTLPIIDPFKNENDDPCLLEDTGGLNVMVTYESSNTCVTKYIPNYADYMFEEGILKLDIEISSGRIQLELYPTITDLCHEARFVDTRTNEKYTVKAYAFGDMLESAFPEVVDDLMG